MFAAREAFINLFQSKHMLLLVSPNPAPAGSYVEIRAECHPSLGPAMLTIGDVTTPLSADRPRQLVQVGTVSLPVLLQAGSERRSEVITTVVDEAPRLPDPTLRGDLVIGRQTSIACEANSPQYEFLMTAKATQGSVELAQAQQRGRRVRLELGVTPINANDPVILQVVAETQHVDIAPDRARTVLRRSIAVTKPRPKLEVAPLPASLNVGEATTIGWRSAEAISGEVKILLGDTTVALDVEASGAMPFVPRLAGTATIQVTAKAADGEIDRVTRTIQVNEPRFEFGEIARAAALYAPPGETVVFAWAVRGARELWVVPDDCSGAVAVHSAAALSVEVGWHVRTFQLVAIDHGGETHTLTLKASTDAA